MASVIEAIRGRGKTRLYQAQLDIEPVSDAISAAVKTFDTHMAGSSPLEVKDPFGNWKEFDPEEVRAQVGDHIDNLVRNSKRMDACRGVSGLQVVVFEARNHLRAMNLSAREFTRLGDGTAVHLGNGQWGFTQKKGVSWNESSFSIRQKGVAP